MSNALKDGIFRLISNKLSMEHNYCIPEVGVDALNCELVPNVPSKLVNNNNQDRYSYVMQSRIDPSRGSTGMPSQNVEYASQASSEHLSEVIKRIELNPSPGVGSRTYTEFLSPHSMLDSRYSSCSDQSSVGSTSPFPSPNPDNRRRKSWDHDPGGPYHSPIKIRATDNLSLPDHQLYTRRNTSGHHNENYTHLRTIQQPTVLGRPPSGKGAPPPNFKTMRSLSRTNLKQQLQRDALREEELREQKKRAAASSHMAVDIPTPPPVLPVKDVPQEILKVSSRLENPTLFHLHQKQIEQVNNYFHESEIGDNNKLSTGASPSIPSNIPAPKDPKVEDLIDDILSLEASKDVKTRSYVVEGNNSAPNKAAHHGNMHAIIEPVDAPIITSDSCPAEIPVDTVHQLTEAELQAAIARDRQKKDNHNMIERRRRFNINDRIKDLGALLPRSKDPMYSNIVRDQRQNKGVILKASVDYVKELKMQIDATQKEKEHIIVQYEHLAEENRALKQHIQLMQAEAKAAGLSTPTFTMPTVENEAAGRIFSSSAEELKQVVADLPDLHSLPDLEYVQLHQDPAEAESAPEASNVSPQELLDAVEQLTTVNLEDLIDDGAADPMFCPAWDGPDFMDTIS